MFVKFNELFIKKKIPNILEDVLYLFYGKGKLFILNLYFNLFKKTWLLGVIFKLYVYADVIEKLG